MGSRIDSYVEGDETGYTLKELDGEWESGGLIGGGGYTVLLSRVQETYLLMSSTT